ESTLDTATSPLSIATKSPTPKPPARQMATAKRKLGTAPNNATPLPYFGKNAHMTPAESAYVSSIKAVPT
ncbi:hypothetical protein FRC01_011977, partial [Tulasnella sp. 417]